MNAYDEAKKAIDEATEIAQLRAKIQEQVNRTVRVPQIKDSGDRTEFPSGAVRDMATGKGRYDLIPWEAIHELALHCEQGAEKYGERNVNRGIPLHSLIDSSIRHLSCYLRGMKDEPHLRSALWNIAWAIWMEKNKPEMQDIPARMEGGK